MITVLVVLKPVRPDLIQPTFLVLVLTIYHFNYCKYTIGMYSKIRMTKWKQTLIGICERIRKCWPCIWPNSKQKSRACIPVAL